jgi:hypothetical protein
LQAGEIIEQGTHQDLIERRGFYYDLYMSQFRRKVDSAAAEVEVDEDEGFLVAGD